MIIHIVVCVGTEFSGLMLKVDGGLHANLHALSHQKRRLRLVEEGEDWLQLETKLLKYHPSRLINLTAEDTEIEGK